MLRVGLTGGIGSGKSEVARRLEACGAWVIDSDVLAREVVAPGTDGYAEVLAAFGPQVRAADGSLDRAALGRWVFADAETRRRLEQIVHPRVRERAGELEAEAPADGVVVQVIPLLVETGQGAAFDRVVVVDVPEPVQVARLADHRGLEHSDARARIAAQASRTERLAVADMVIDNAGTRETLAEQVERLWGQLERAARSTETDSDSADAAGEAG